MNYDYNEYDQEIKAAIRAQNSPFKDNMPVYRSDCDDVSSNTSYSPAKYGFRLVASIHDVVYLPMKSVSPL